MFPSGSRNPGAFFLCSLPNHPAMDGPMQQISEATTATLTDESDSLPEFIEQRWSDYTPEQHDVWGLLYQRRMNQLASDGSRVFLDGARSIGLRKDRVPDLAEVNARLERV